MSEQKQRPASRLSTVKPVFAWVEVSNDYEPSIWNVAWYRENLRADLRHIRVKITPVARKKKKSA